MMPPRDPLITLRIPRINNEELLPIKMSPGDVLFVIGANGTGKSGLLQYLNRIYMNDESRSVMWIPSHRQTWMENSQTMSAQQKAEHEENFREFETIPQSRWSLSFPEIRPSVTLSKLVLTENERARMIADAVDDDRYRSAKAVANEVKSSLRQMNDILRHANIPITIFISPEESIEARKAGGDHYGAAELSDGERAMLLLATDILTCPQGTLLLIDEPEVHMHRAIASPVLQELFSRRDDCFFVISTHELSLPIDNPTAQILVTRGCEFDRRYVAKWTAELIDSDSLGEGVKRDILGARSEIIFVEGEDDSLDRLLYDAVFPKSYVVPKGGKHEVRKAVTSTRGISQMQWLTVYGLVDGDGDNTEDRKDADIYSLNVYAVESIYYDCYIQELVAKDTETAFDEAQPRLDVAKEESMREFSQLESVPNDYIEAGNYELILRECPIKQRKGALFQIAKGLGFSNCSKYEAAVRRILKSDERALQYVKGLLGGLPERIERDRAASPEQGT